MMEKYRIGIVSFTDPRAVSGIDEIDRRNIENQKRLVNFLGKEGFQCCVPLKDSSVNGRAAADKTAGYFQSKDVHAMIFGCWKWTDPMLAVEVARRVDRPLLLYAEDEEDSTPLGCLAAVGAALWEIAPHENAKNHARIIGDPGAAAAWARGVCALGRLRGQSLLLWGGSYCLKMPHLEDDSSALKRFLVGDVLTEDQYFLVRGAEDILADKKRAVGFLKWLEKSGAQIEYDRGMATEDNLMRQAALYLAARDRLDELECENIGGISVKCQPALSELYGVTGCLIPSFIPFNKDSEGKRESVPAVCEGDVKGLVTSMLLSNISGGIPPGFGDIRHIRHGGRVMLIVSNCGGASVHYAGAKKGRKGILGGVCLKAQCQGAGGCSVGYRTQAFGTATIARLVRREGRYAMQYAVGRSMDVNGSVVDRLGWGAMWPLSMFDIDMDLDSFVSNMGSNHYSFVPGDVTAELSAACAAAGIEMENMAGHGGN